MSYHSTELIEFNDLKKLLNTNKNDKQKVQVIAKKTAKNILSNIVQVTEKIQEAKGLVRDSENCKSDWSNKFSLGLVGKSKTDKRAELNTKAISQQNEAMIEMNKLIQESIKLTCCSILFAQEMTRTISVMIANGFKDREGKHIKLTQASQEQAEFIVQQAEDFIKHQHEYEERQNQQDEDIIELRGNIKKNEEDIGLNKENINQNKQSIVQNQQNIGQNKENIEKNRSEIETLHLKLKDKENIDNAQEQEIKNLKTKLENLEAKVDKKGSFIPYLFSAFALLIAIISLAMNFIDFTK